jgi:hypothetical protein
MFELLTAPSTYSFGLKTNDTKETSAHHSHTKHYDIFKDLSLTKTRAKHRILSCYVL